MDETEISWTPFNMARTVTAADDSSTSFYYDASGARTVRVAENKTTISLRGLFEFNRTAANGGKVTFEARYRVPATGGSVVEIRDTAPEFSSSWSREVLYQYADNLGSGSVLASEDGSVEQQVSYDAWGNARSWTDWAATIDPTELESMSSGFTGHQPELDTGLINMRGRMYSPHLARFMSADPIVESIGDAQTWNAYSYVSNNPLKFVDPSGLAAELMKPLQDPGVGGCYPCEESGTGTGGGSTGSGGGTAVPIWTPPQGSTPGGEGPYENTGGLPANDGGHSGAATDGPSNGAGQGGPSVKYDVGSEGGESQLRWGRFRDAVTNELWRILAPSPVVSEGELGWGQHISEGAAAVFDWFVEDGIETTLTVRFGPLYSAVRPDGGLGVYVRGQFGLGHLGGSRTYAVTKGSLSALTFIASWLSGTNTGDNRGEAKPTGFGVSDPPARIEGAWTKEDIWRGLHGRPPKSLGSPDLHHADQMPGSAVHEILPGPHRGNKLLHPNKYNQGVTPEMRQQDRQLHWWYRAREQGADQIYPGLVYEF